jgi:hypothetical protein
MKRFSIMVLEYGAEREVELCQLDGDTEPTILGLKAKTLMVHTGKPGTRRRTRIPKYTNIRVVDHQAEEMRT